MRNRMPDLDERDESVDATTFGPLHDTLEDNYDEESFPVT